MSASELAYRLGAAARRPASWWQLAKFGLVGISGYVINLGVFALLSGNFGLHHAIAAIGAFLVAVSSNFFWNRHWTFTAGDGHAGFQAMRFFVGTVIAATVHAGVVYVLTERLHVYYVISKFAADILVFTGGNLLIYRYLVFPKTHEVPR